MCLVKTNPDVQWALRWSQALARCSLGLTVWLLNQSVREFTKLANLMEYSVVSLQQFKVWRQPNFLAPCCIMYLRPPPHTYEYTALPFLLWAPCSQCSKWPHSLVLERTHLHLESSSPVVSYLPSPLPDFHAEPAGLRGSGSYILMG